MDLLSWDSLRAIGHSEVPDDEFRLLHVPHLRPANVCASQCDNFSSLEHDERCSFAKVIGYLTVSDRPIYLAVLGLTSVMGCHIALSPAYK